MKFIVISHAFKQLNKFFYLWLHKKLINTDQLISVNALGLAHKTIQFYAIKFVQKYYQPYLKWETLTFKKVYVSHFKADNIYIIRYFLPQ